MNKSVLKLVIVLFTLILLLSTEEVFADTGCGPDNPLACRPLPENEMLISAASEAVTPLAAATGYCSSVGGSTSYESISSVSAVQSQDKLTITVNVYIANPTGCSAGSPCPEYDSSPEYVNVWIDYDGDGSWESQEKVMNEAGTGYLNINYHGTMTFIKTVTVPAGAVADTWLRANLGWGYDPENPCESSWAWGNVVDKAVHIESKTPQIEDIDISPTNPETTKDVTFTAKLKNMTGYEVVKIAWSGDIQSGEGNPSYTVKPAAGTHGKDKNITATLTYRKSGATQTGIAPPKSKKFNLFFEKAGDEDGDGTPNWFEYWRQVLSLNVSYVAPVDWGSTDTTTGAVSIGNNAGFGPEPRHGKTGIDCFYCVSTHELQHQADVLYCNTTYGSVLTVPTSSDNDGDHLPNERDSFPNTVNGAGYPEYASSWVGDWEFNARQVENVTADATLDWAHPGKQSTTTVVSCFSVGYAGGFGYIDVSNGAQAEFTGTFKDYGRDIDGDGGNDYLTVEVELNVKMAGSLTVIGGLDGTDYTVWAANQKQLDVGIQTVRLDFDGHEIRRHRENGPYLIALRIDNGLSLNTNSLFTYFTSSYEYIDFSATGSEIVGNYIESRHDENANGLYEKLNIAVDIAVETPGQITLLGFLHAADGTPIAYAEAVENLLAGNRVLTLSFDGRHIRQSHSDGPYKLRSLALFEGTDRTDFIYEAYETAAYSHTAFEGGEAEFASLGTFNDYGVDSDGDGLFDNLRIEVTADIQQAGDYSLIGRLFDEDGNSIDDVLIQQTLSQGQHSLPLDFSGVKIHKNGKPGPYLLRYAFVYGSDGSLLDSLPQAYSTAAYEIWQFEMYLASMTGRFHDLGRDTNGNGLFDELIVAVEVDAVASGNVVVQARLESSDGVELGTANNFVTINSGPEWVELTFDGRNIFASGKNGPYNLTDVRAYHTGDPSLSEIVEDAYLTADYAPTEFEPTAVIRGTVMHSDETPIGGALISADSESTYSSDLGEYYLGLAQTGIAAVSIESPASVTTGTWYYTLNGGEPIMGSTAIVDLSIGVVIHLDWIFIVDKTPPDVAVVMPDVNDAVQDGITLKADANDASGVDAVSFYVREPNDGNGVPIGQENLAGTFNSATGKWEYNFNTTQLPDGFYVVLAKAVDTYGNIGWSEVVPFSIRNWAIITMLPSTPNSKAGRTMPVKFSLRIAAAVDPAMPFVYNDELEIRIYDRAKPGVILQRSVFGSGSTNYRIDMTIEKYITNFKTKTTPATYVVEVWRPAKNFKVGSFTFATTK